MKIVDARFGTFLLALAVTLPALAYDYPLSSQSIRTAYLLGKGSGSAGTHFLAEYSRTLPGLKVGAYTSVVRIETPFTHVAEHARETLNYDAQDAVKEFVDKPSVFRAYLDICYAPIKAKPIKVRFLQNDKEIASASDKREPYYPFQDSESVAPSIGEHIELEFKPEKIESSPLLIEIDTPNGQHVETTFDLAKLR